MIRKTFEVAPLWVMRKSTLTAMQRLTCLSFMFSDGEPVDTHQVAERIGESMPVARAALSALVGAGLITRVTVLRDDRAVAVFTLGGKR